MSLQSSEVEFKIIVKVFQIQADTIIQHELKFHATFHKRSNRRILYFIYGSVLTFCFILQV